MQLHFTTKEINIPTMNGIKCHDLLLFPRAHLSTHFDLHMNFNNKKKHTELHIHTHLNSKISVADSKLHSFIFSNICCTYKHRLHMKHTHGISHSHKLENTITDSKKLYIIFTKICTIKISSKNSSLIPIPQLSFYHV